MILAYHVIFTMYGFWLPNDPRGSWSDFVRNWELFRYGGPATKVDTRRSVAHRAHDQSKRLATKQKLKYPPVELVGVQALAVARGFAQAIADAQYCLWACAILPDHVHAVIKRDGRHAEQIVSHLKRAASRQLREENLHPFAQYAEDGGSPPSPWARKCWNVYLDDEADIRRAIAYVEDNPLREGKRRQNWNFVTAYDA